jgi:hypothetical protein
VGFGDGGGSAGPVRVGPVLGVMGFVSAHDTSDLSPTTCWVSVVGLRRGTRVAGPLASTMSVLMYVHAIVSSC